MLHFATKNNNELELLKLSHRQGFNFIQKLGLTLVLINCLTISPSLANREVQVKNMYLSDSGALVIETKDQNQIKDFELLKAGKSKYKLVLKNVDLEKNFLKDFNESHTNFKITKQLEKKSFFDKKKNLELDIECSFNCDAQFEPVLGGLAYKVSFSKKIKDNAEEKLTEIQTPIKEEISSAIDLEIDEEVLILPKEVIANNQSVSTTHILQANKKENFLYAITREESPVEEFINQLDDTVSSQILGKKDFQKENLAKADSASLNYIADELAELGQSDLAAEAYFKALKTNPENLNAILGLARNSKDKQEKLKYYLQAIDEEALLSIGKTWFEEGINTGNSKKIEQAMIGYQFAVLKSPANPYYRYSFAQALEKSGYQNFEQASKRYLEAAVLAKKDFKSGDNTKEDIMRRSTECLIKVLVKKGSQDQAVHYCNSYIGLGYENFLDGRSIKGIMKELNSNKNPFS